MYRESPELPTETLRLSFPIHRGVLFIAISFLLGVVPILLMRPLYGTLECDRAMRCHVDAWWHDSTSFRRADLSRIESLPGLRLGRWVSCPILHIAGAEDPLFPTDLKSGDEFAAAANRALASGQPFSVRVPMDRTLLFVAFFF